MYRVKLFSAERMELLQQTINEWLQANKDILIHASNITGNSGEAIGVNEYVFFILYAATEDKETELKEMAAVVTQEQSVEVKEINPAILKPSS
ncbi:MAG TPA: hypothetical protein VL307_14820 [Chitinophagaceae bacterium]|nr:hypothetical protein [Chitinophagaceae bacterium]